MRYATTNIAIALRAWCHVVPVHATAELTITSQPRPMPQSHHHHHHHHSLIVILVVVIDASYPAAPASSSSLPPSHPPLPTPSLSLLSNPLDQQLSQEACGGTGEGH